MSPRHCSADRGPFRRDLARIGRCALVALAFAVVLGSPSPVRAWSPAGHMVLGAVAYAELERIDPEALEAVVALLQQHPHHGELIDGSEDRALDAETRRIALFMRAARWADDVRSEPWDEYSRSNWHYVNYRYRPPSDLRPPRGPDQDGYLLWALEENVRRLGSDSDSVRAIALTWLFHLVTDIHQPLHNIAMIDLVHPDGDRGGNSRFVRRAPGGEPLNLHWFWDGLVAVPGPVPGLALTSRALRQRVDHGPEAIGEIDTDDVGATFERWALEGAHLAVEKVYRNGALETGSEDEAPVLPDPYQRQSYELAVERGTLGALRLAHLLSALF